MEVISPKELEERKIVSGSMEGRAGSDLPFLVREWCLWMCLSSKMALWIRSSEIFQLEDYRGRPVIRERGNYWPLVLYYMFYYC